VDFWIGIPCLLVVSCQHFRRTFIGKTLQDYMASQFRIPQLTSSRRQLQFSESPLH
jgi:hypothetical protein